MSRVLQANGQLQFATGKWLSTKNTGLGGKMHTMLAGRYKFLSNFYKCWARIEKPKKTILPICTLVSLLLLIGCGGGSSGSSAAVATPPPVDNSVDGDSSDPIDVDDTPILPFSSLDAHWEDIGVFSSASSCSECHKASTDNSNTLREPVSGNDISPEAGWRHSLMANSFSDPYFQAVMQNEVAEFPAIAGFIEDKCLNCHTPMSRTHAHQTGTSLSTDSCSLSDGCYRLQDSLDQMHAREGISCTACHQMQANDNDSGEYVISSTDRIIFGPQENPLAGPMLNNTQYQLEASSHISDSQFCGGCHDLSTPSIDVNTGELSEHKFPEQTPYKEWENSIFSQSGPNAKSCQDCHMPEIDNYQTALAVKRNGETNSQWPIRENYSQHTFVGANIQILSMLQEQREVLGIADVTTVDGFQRQIDLTREFISNNSADLAVDSMSYGNESLNIDVSIHNKSGHKFPSSYPSRRVWLNLIVRDSSGAILFQSGTPGSNGLLDTDSVQGGVSCTQVQKSTDYRVEDCYSAHQNVIESEQQVAVYEAVMADSNGHSNYMLLYGDHYLKDNRIPPVGYTELLDNPLFDKTTAIAGLARQDDDFNKAANGDQGTGRDVVHYQIPWAANWPMNPAEVEVEIILYYQSIRPAFAAALQGDHALITHFADSYRQHPPKPEVIANLSARLP
ncbi:MAG: hypothetical protein V7708_10915 [Oceanicoccus sp.]